MAAKGWFKIKGVRDGDRTLDEQMKGLAPALSEASGKTILDLGCAEGCISREFAKAGAKRVLGIELLETHLLVAKMICKDYPQIEFIHSHLDDYVLNLTSFPRYDIVLALSVIHKLKDPALPLRFAAQSAKSLLVFRPPARLYKGMVRSKHSKTAVDVAAVMREEGFALEQTIQGVRGESAQYWRRK